MDTAGKATRIGFIGAGRVGSVLATTLHEAGYPVVAVASRSLASARALADRIPGCVAFEQAQAVAETSDVVFLTTPDDVIADVVAMVPWHPGQTVVHTSGVHSLDVLAAAAQAGALTGSMHPLQTFADPGRGLDLLRGTAFAIEGDHALLPFLHGLVQALGGYAIELPPGAKTFYHIAAVLVSNYTVTLAKLATDLWARFGVEREEALRALLPLLRGTLANLEALSLSKALTGPIARGDTGTVRYHIEALTAHAPALLAVYRSLGLQTVPLAQESDRLPQTVADELATVLRADGVCYGAGVPS